jgi:acetyltransferase-like isoleucine patch superfamily enzyme
METVRDNVRIHPTAHVHPSAEIGPGAQVWHGVQIRERAKIGERCILGQGAYVDLDVVIGPDCKLQNYVCTFVGVTLESGVFVGPHACFTNDLNPRAVNADGSIKSATDWTVSKTLVKHGAAIGANSTIVCGVTIGRWALVAAGSVVSRDVPDHGLVRGNPARLVGFVSAHGYKATPAREPAAGDTEVEMRCSKTGETFRIPIDSYRLLKNRAQA